MVKILEGALEELHGISRGRRAWSVPP